MRRRRRASKVWAVMKNGEPARQGGPPADGRRLHGRRDGQVAPGRPSLDRDAVCRVALQGAPQFVQRVGGRHASGGERRFSSFGRRLSPDAALRAGYDAFGSERYVLTFDNKRLREAAAAAPYEFIEIVVNDRKYGGGGIHNLYATVAADNASTPYVFVHEFGHHFAALADEYYTSDVAYEASPRRPEPWEPNVTADPQSPKWKDMIAAGHAACPRPWAKAEFEAMQKQVQARRREIRAQHRPEYEMEALFAEELIAD